MVDIPTFKVIDILKNEKCGEFIAGTEVRVKGEKGEEVLGIVAKHVAVASRLEGSPGILNPKEFHYLLASYRDQIIPNLSTGQSVNTIFGSDLNKAREALVEAFQGKASCTTQEVTDTSNVNLRILGAKFYLQKDAIYDYAETIGELNRPIYSYQPYTTSVRSYEAHWNEIEKFLLGGVGGVEWSSKNGHYFKRQILNF